MPIPVTTVNEYGLNEGAVVAAGAAFVDTVEEQLPKSKSEEDKKEIERLRSKCQDYKDNENRWKFLLRSYEGGENYIGEDTLFRHPREASTDYDQRVKRAHYPNYCAPLVDFVPEYIFSQDVERDAPQDLKDEYEAFKRDVDKAGTELNTFMQTVGEDMRIFGKVYILVDKPSKPEDEGEISVQRERELGLTPYLVLVRPLEVLDWRTDSRGNLIYLKRVECTSLEQGDSYVDVERYTEWTKQQLKISLVDVTDKDEPKLMGAARLLPNAWKQIPFVPVYFKRKKSNRDLGHSFLEDIAYQNRAVFNQTSLIDEFLYRQCFNILAMPAKQGVPYKEQVEGNVGTANTLEIPPDAQHLPQYITPPVDPAEFIQKEREITVREMYRQAAQDLISEMMSPGRQTGDSQRVQFSRTVPVINKTADALQYAERQAMVLWATMQSKTWDGGKISYKDDYSVTNLLDLLTQLGVIFNTLHLWSPTFIKEEWKRVVREFDGKIDAETLAKIITEIDKLSEDDLKLQMAQAADVQAVPGAPSMGNMLQGQSQSRLGSDKKIAAATGSKAATKETLPDANKRTTTGSRR